MTSVKSTCTDGTGEGALGPDFRGQSGTGRELVDVVSAQNQETRFWSPAFFILAGFKLRRNDWRSAEEKSFTFAPHSTQYAPLMLWRNLT